MDTVFFSTHRGSKNELELELPMKEVVQVSVIVTTYQLILEVVKIASSTLLQWNRSQVLKARRLKIQKC